METRSIRLLELLDGQVQYVVPRWQRRFCWGQSDIERLVEDLAAVADGDPDSTHYGGTILTFREPGAAGVVSTIRVVDGQQRLTTLSILLACIARELGPNGECDGWTAQHIIDDRLTNPGKSAEKFRKLRLQDGDEDEYRQGLEAEPSGMGAVTQAWRIARRLVARERVDRLLRGLLSLRVVSIGLDEREDPQQIFASLNATGRPLRESEKVKNWLLMGLPDSKQQELYEDCWLQIERCLDATHSTESVDVFLRDLLRWQTGTTVGIDHIYEGIRRWAVKTGKEQDRSSVFREFTRLAGLYGKISGTAKSHRNAKVERELRHLREMGIDVHRPLSLRLLSDADAAAGGTLDDADLSEILRLIGTWTTRMWLADKRFAGMNKAMADLAHEIGPGDGADPVEYWRGKISRRRASLVGVPGDQEIQYGIRHRKVTATNVRIARAILFELMEAEHREESPDRRRLTIEHVMPKKLTDEWKQSLGEQAEGMHERFLNCLPNLTLSGDATNSKMGASSFEAKKMVYRKSPIGLTSRLSFEDAWDKEALERRADDLASRAIDRWPWHEQRTNIQVRPVGAPNLQWRLDGGPWKEEQSASGMIKNVVSVLLSMDSDNAHRLSGQAISTNVHSSRRYPPGSAAGAAMMMHAVPGHPDYVIYPFGQDYAHSAKRCMKMGERCGVKIEVEFDEQNQAREFWRLLKATTGGLPGQKSDWRGTSQTTIPLNSKGDRIGIFIGHPDMLRLFVTRIGNKHLREHIVRMRDYSRSISENMSDQNLSNDLEKESLEGRSISVCGAWMRDDEEEWPAAAHWVKDQFDRMRTIISDQTVSNNGE